MTSRAFLGFLPLVVLAGVSCPSPEMCVDDHGCESGFCVQGVCKESGRQCTTSADCSSGEACLDGVCVVENTCFSDGDCDSGFLCASGVCQSIGCEANDCATGFYCDRELGECVPQHCSGDEDCEGDRICNLDNRLCAAPGEVPSPEVCDGIDNDLDGEVDEYFDVGADCTVGVGACVAIGLVVCVERGDAECSAQASRPASEICDGADNDCDGDVDEGYQVGELCNGGMGECAVGLVACEASGEAMCVPIVMPTTESCDGLDNDCDGSVDEDFMDEGGLCVYGLGVCAVPGWMECGRDGTSAACVPSIEPQPTPGTEVCDGVDNDCDGVVDEMCP